MVAETLERDRTAAPSERDEHRGKWVAIADGEVVASGDSPGDVLEIVKRLGLEGWALDRIPEDPDSIFVL